MRQAAYPSVFKLAWLVGGLTLLARLVLALRDIALAHWGGVGHSVDLFQFLFAITAFIYAGLGAAVGMALVPVLAHAEGAARRQLAARCEGWLLLGGTGLAAGLWALVAATHVFGQMAPEDDPVAVLLAVAAMCACVPMLLLCGAYTARLQLAGAVSYVLSEALPPACAIAQMTLAGGFWLPGFCGAILLGTLAQAVVLGWLAARVDGAVWPSIGSVAGLGLPMAMGWTLLSQTIISVQQVVDPWIASGYGAGGIARLAYGNRIVNMGVTLMVVVIARVLLPRLSLLLAKGEGAMAWSLARRFAMVLGGLGLAVSALCWWQSGLIVHLVFLRARFAAEDASAVAGVLAYGALMFAPCWAGLVWLQMATAQRLYRAICFASLLGMLAKYAFVALTIAPLGVNALPAATAVWQVVVVVVYRLAVGRRSGQGQ